MRRAFSSFTRWRLFGKGLGHSPIAGRVEQAGGPMVRSLAGQLLLYRPHRLGEETVPACEYAVEEDMQKAAVAQHNLCHLNYVLCSISV